MYNYYECDGINFQMVSFVIISLFSRQQQYIKSPTELQLNIFIQWALTQRSWCEQRRFVCWENGSIICLFIIKFTANCHHLFWIGRTFFISLFLSFSSYQWAYRINENSLVYWRLNVFIDFDWMPGEKMILCKWVFVNTHLNISVKQQTHCKISNLNTLLAGLWIWRW